jgi:DNA-binding NarL/FixJ family response regulator
MTFVPKLHAALARDEPTTVHEIVANALHSFDPVVQITHTGFFTHTFVPDLVLHWASPEGRQARNLHLRFNILSPAFGDDLTILGDQSPIFLEMTGTGLATGEWRAHNALTETLVLDAEAIECFAALARQHVSASEAVARLIRSGYGVIDQVRANQLAASFSSALSALAGSSDVVATRTEVTETLAMFGEHVSEVGRLAIERLLGVEWIRQGGKADTFPGQAPWKLEPVRDRPPKDALPDTGFAIPSPTPRSVGKPSGELRVLVVDDDPLARRIIRDALQRAGIIVIAEAHNGESAVELALFYRPDVVLMDVVMPTMDGIEATRRIVRGDPGAKIVILTGADDNIGLVALRAGATGFLSKDIDVESLPRAVRGVQDGEAAISRRLSALLLEDIRQSHSPPRGAPLPTMTQRELEIMDLLAAGASTTEVAESLVLSTETVRSHVKNILRKLDLRSREELVATVERMGMRGSSRPET